MALAEQPLFLLCCSFARRVPRTTSSSLPRPPSFPSSLGNMASSSSNDSKRKRGPSPPSSSSSVKPPAITYHSDFPKTPTSDVLLLSSPSNTAFETSKIYLQASSSVFAFSLLVGTDGNSEHFDDLPIIKLDEDVHLLSRFLAFVQTSPIVPPVSISSVEAVDKLPSLCDKYDAPLVARSIAAHYLPPLLDAIDQELSEVGEELCDVLALALIHFQFGNRGFVERAIRLMGYQGETKDETDVRFPIHSREGIKMSSKGVRWRPLGVGDIKLSLLKG